MKALPFAVALLASHVALAEGLRVGTVRACTATVLLSTGNNKWREITASDVNHLIIRAGDQIAVRPGGRLQIFRRNQVRTFDSPGHFLMMVRFTPQEDADKSRDERYASSAAKNKGARDVLWPSISEPASASQFEIFLTKPPRSINATINTRLGMSVFSGKLFQTDLGGFSNTELVSALRKQTPGETLLMTIDGIQGTYRFRLMDSDRDKALVSAMNKDPEDTVEGILERVDALIKSRQWTLAAAWADRGGSQFSGIAASIASNGFYRSTPRD